MGMSIDGFVTGPDGEIDWSVPDEELHSFHNDRVREQSAQLCGRQLYEAMLYWETADQDPDAGPIEHDFAQVWRARPEGGGLRGRPRGGGTQHPPPARAPAARGGARRGPRGRG